MLDQVGLKRYEISNFCIPVCVATNLMSQHLTIVHRVMRVVITYRIGKEATTWELDQVLYKWSASQVIYNQCLTAGAHSRYTVMCVFPHLLHVMHTETNTMPFYGEYLCVYILCRFCQSSQNSHFTHSINTLEPNAWMAKVHGYM